MQSMPHSSSPGRHHMLGTSVPGRNRTELCQLLTRVDGEISQPQRNHSNKGSQPWALPVRDHAHRYSRGVHANVCRGALTL
jgi:hypothetical protein